MLRLVFRSHPSVETPGESDVFMTMTRARELSGRRAQKALRERSLPRPFRLWILTPSFSLASLLCLTPWKWTKSDGYHSTSCFFPHPRRKVLSGRDYIPLLGVWRHSPIFFDTRIPVLQQFQKARRRKISTEQRSDRVTTGTSRYDCLRVRCIHPAATFPRRAGGTRCLHVRERGYSGSWK